MGARLRVVRRRAHAAALRAPQRVAGIISDGLSNLLAVVGVVVVSGAIADLAGTAWSHLFIGVSLLAAAFAMTSPSKARAKAAGRRLPAAPDRKAA